MVAMYEFTNCSAVLHAIQWLHYSIGEFITESAILAMGAKYSRFTGGCPGVSRVIAFVITGVISQRHLC